MCKSFWPCPMLPSLRVHELTSFCLSESTSIPVNPRTNRPVGYAFVDLKSAEEAQKAIDNLSGNDILERKVSVQLARKSEETKEDGSDGKPKRPSGRGRGGRSRGRGGRTTSGRGGKAVEVSDVLNLTISILLTCSESWSTRCY